MGRSLRSHPRFWRCISHQLPPRAAKPLQGAGASVPRLASGLSHAVAPLWGADARTGLRGGVPRMGVPSTRAFVPSTNSIDVAAHAGTAFDGPHISSSRKLTSIRSIRRAAACSSRSRRPARGLRPRMGRWNALGRTVSGPKIHQIDPETGAILRTIESKPLRHRRHLGRRSALARYLGGQSERAPASGSERRARYSKHWWRGPLGARVRRRRSVLLWRRKQRKGEGCSSAPAAWAPSSFGTGIDPELRMCDVI